MPVVRYISTRRCRPAEGHPWLDRAREVARRLGSQALLQDITLVTVESDTKNGRYGADLDLMMEVLDIARSTGDFHAQIRCLTTLSLQYAAIADPSSSTRMLEEARRLLGLNPERLTECELHAIEAAALYLLRDYGAALVAATRALDLSKEYNFSYEAASSSHRIGASYLRLDRRKQAYAFLRYSYGLCKERGFEKIEMTNVRDLGFIDATEFRSADGLEQIEAASSFAEERGYTGDQLEALYVLAIAHNRLGYPDDAQAALRNVVKLASQYGDVQRIAEAEGALRMLDASSTAVLSFTATER